MTRVAGEIRDLRVQFPVRRGRKRAFARAVDGVTLSVHEGEIVALVGESGCGKTTIARTFVRLLDPTSGSVLVAGTDITRLTGPKLRRMRAEVQMIFQDPYESLPVNATALDVVAEGLALHHPELDRAARMSKALAALDECGLHPAAAIGARRMFQLSGGQRQRVAIAAALAVAPRLLIADEPVSMLDVSLRAGVLQVLLDLRDRKGIATLFITHDLALAGVYADTVAVLYLGRVVEQGPAADVLASPQHPYTRALVEVMPVPGRRDHGGHILSGEPPSPTDDATGCRFAQRCPRYRELGSPDRCRTEVPHLVQNSAKHFLACHFPHPTSTEEHPT